MITGGDALPSNGKCAFCNAVLPDFKVKAGCKFCNKACYEAQLEQNRVRVRRVRFTGYMHGAGVFTRDKNPLEPIYL